jgi:predicted nucleic acid-binding protein
VRSESCARASAANAHVSAWYASIAEEDLFLSTLVLGEIRKGIELARPRDPDKAAARRYADEAHRCRDRAADRHAATPRKMHGSSDGALVIRR